MELWSLTPRALDGEWWRLWTGHLVHYGLGHLLVNALAATLPLVLLPSRLRMALLARAFWMAPLMSIVLLGIGGFHELRGLSGVAVFLWCGAGIFLMRDERVAEGSALLIAVIAKLMLERQSPAPWSGGNFEVSTAAHALAAVLAIVSVVSLSFPIEVGRRRSE